MWHAFWLTDWLIVCISNMLAIKNKLNSSRLINKTKEKTDRLGVGGSEKCSNVV